MPKNDNIAVLDIGTAKMVCFIAHADPQQQLVRIIGVGHQASQGFCSGIITDIEKARDSILATVHAAEKDANAEIDDVFLCVSGLPLVSHMDHMTLDVSGHEVTGADCDQILAKSYQRALDAGLHVMHCLPVSYDLDAAKGITGPIGMYGRQLGASVHIVGVEPDSLMNLSHCFSRCHLNIRELIAAPYASALSSLSRDEQQLGCIMIDMGAGSTAISFFQDDQMIYTATLPLGGMHITRDIARAFSLPMHEAERIKTLHGVAIATEADKKRKIRLPQPGSDAPVSETDEQDEPDFFGMNAQDMMEPDGDNCITQSALSAIIRPRAEEILEMALDLAKQSKFYDTLGNRVVITGGGSQLQAIKELTAHIFSRQVRIATPASPFVISDATSAPSFASALGMLHHIKEHPMMMQRLRKQASSNRSRIMGRLTKIWKTLG